MIYRIIKLLILLLVIPNALACAQPKNNQFTFSWQYGEQSRQKPRGGTSKGPAVKPENSVNKNWTSIREKGISEFERDRRAILALAGTYRTSFNFIETASLKENYQTDNPYQSWATEYIEVINDSGDSISLQHILVMYFTDENGNIVGPFTTKHWRQDWNYEDNVLLEYVGRATWKKTRRDEDRVKGSWTQAVYQVDDSPRYEGIGKWVHKDNYSSWKSNETRRPLPRRESSVRKDYDVLAGINLVYITPDGWIHEQQNLKLALRDKKNPLENNTYIARELGVNRYEKIVPDEYIDGKRYLDDTGNFWEIVRNKWNQIISVNNSVKIEDKYKDKKLFEYLFDYADEIRTNKTFNKSEAELFVNRIIDNFVNVNESQNLSSY